MNYKLISFLILLTFLFSCSERKVPEVHSTDNQKINYAVKGSGDLTLVFIHGWSCDKSYWDAQMNYFSDDYQCIVIDLAGHGQSEATRTDYTMDLFADDVASVINSIETEEIVLVGHSMGGVIAAKASNKINNKVLAIVGVDNFQEPDAISDPIKIETFLKNMKSNFKSFSRKFVYSMFGKKSDERVKKFIMDDISSSNVSIAISTLRNAWSANEAKALDDSNLPLYCINSDMFKVHESSVRKYTSYYKLSLIKGYGHFLMKETPNLFNAELRKVLEDIENKLGN